MAVTRQGNWLEQQRVDIPHMRSIESSVCGDFDVLVGRALTGSAPLIVRGFEVGSVGVGIPPTSLTLNAADGLVFNLQAAESGSFLWVPASTPIDALIPITNPKIVGGWSAGTINFVGVGFIREPDDTTIDVVAFRDPSTGRDAPKQVPLAKTLDYAIHISSTPFSSTTTIVPVAKITLDSAGLITSVEDARPMMFRLGAGGDSPDRYSHYTAWSRPETYSTSTNNAFMGGDKELGSMKGWMDAVMTRIWEVGGGEYWYSATADRNVSLTTYGTPFSTGEYFIWTIGTNTLEWKNLRMVFSGSSSYRVDITNGSSVVLPGQALYIDIDRTKFYAPAWVASTLYAVGDIVVNGGLAYENTTAGTSGLAGPAGTGTGIIDGSCVWKYVGLGVVGGLTAHVGDLVGLGTGTPPGSRWVIARRDGGDVFVWGWRYPVGTTLNPATPTAMGAVKISRDYLGNNTPGLSTLNNPIAISDRGGVIVVPAGTLDPVGLDVTSSVGTGVRVSAGVIGVDSQTSSAGGIAGKFTAISLATQALDVIGTSSFVWGGGVSPTATFTTTTLDGVAGRFSATGASNKAIDVSGNIYAVGNATIIGRVSGADLTGNAVTGSSGSGHGVHGTATTGYGVNGIATTGRGVNGDVTTGTAVYGRAGDDILLGGFAGYFEATGHAANTIYAVSTSDGAGVYTRSSGVALEALSTAQDGVLGRTTSPDTRAGVHGISETSGSFGGWFEATNTASIALKVSGVGSAEFDSTILLVANGGIDAHANVTANAVDAVASSGRAINGSATTGYGVYGRATTTGVGGYFQSSTGTALVATTTSGNAAQMTGNVYVNDVNLSGIRAMGRVSTSGGGWPGSGWATNVTSVTFDAGGASITFPFIVTFAGVIAQCTGPGSVYVCRINSVTPYIVGVTIYDMLTSSIIDPTAHPLQLAFMCIDTPA